MTYNLQHKEQLSNQELKNQQLKNQALELVTKHGRNSVEIINRRITAFKTDCRQKDLALMLLTEVEKLVKNK